MEGRQEGKEGREERKGGKKKRNGREERKGEKRKEGTFFNHFFNILTVVLNYDCGIV